MLKAGDKLWSKVAMLPTGAYKATCMSLSNDETASTLWRDAPLVLLHPAKNLFWVLCTAPVLHTVYCQALSRQTSTKCNLNYVSLFTGTSFLSVSFIFEGLNYSLFTFSQIQLQPFHILIVFRFPVFLSTSILAIPYLF